MIKGNAPLKVSVSIGTATICKKDKSIAELLQRADAAMYDAKRAGKARLVEAVS